MKHSIAHDLGHDLARLATRKALEAYRAQFPEYSPEGEWIDEDTATVGFTVLGKKLEGRVTVTPSAVDLDLDVPLLFRPFRGIALDVIEREIRSWMERARNGEL